MLAEIRQFTEIFPFKVYYRLEKIRANQEK